MAIQAQFYSRDFLVPLNVPPTVMFAVDRYGKEAQGGPKDAEIEVAGPIQELWRAVEWLRYPVLFTDNLTGDIWWGYVNEVQLVIGEWTVTVSLDTMSNRIAIKYNTPVTAGLQSAMTTWLQDDDSVATYGTKELLITASDVTQAVAEQQLIKELAQRRIPLSVPDDSSSGTPRARLFCRGWLETAKWRYYSQAAGYEAHTADTGISHKLGLGLTAATISFNGSNEKITDSLKRFGEFDKDDWIVVSGSTSNNGAYLINSAASDGEWIEVLGSLTTEAAGASVTVQIMGEKIGQSFALPGGITEWTIDQVQAKIRTVGSPADSVALELHAHTAGSPGALLDSDNILGSALTDSYDWRTAQMNNTVTMDGTTYWLTLARTGALSPTDYYEVLLDEDAGYSSGEVQLLISGSYVDRSPATDLPFKLIGAWETTRQIQEIVSAACPFLVGVDIIDASGVSAPQYRDGNTTAYEEILNLLELGTSDGSRLLATVTKERYLRIYKEPAPGVEDWIVGTDNVLRDDWDVVVQPQRCPVGFWMQLDIIPATANIARIARASPVFVERTEYLVRENKLKREYKGAPSKWDLGTIRQG